MKKQENQPIPVCRPATRGDTWTYFQIQADGSRLLKVDNKIDVVYFTDGQVIEVHRPVTRIFLKWFGLRKYTETFIEIEEGVYSIPFGLDAEQGHFYFLFYREEVKLCDLPDETCFIPTDKFLRIRGARKKKKKSLLHRLLYTFRKPKLIFVS